MAERADELPGDPICKLPLGANTVIPTTPAERRFNGAAGTRAGSALAAGDVDGDGLPELLIGAPGPVSGSTVRGSVHVVRVMANGTPGLTQEATRIDGEAVGNRLGASVAFGDYTGGAGGDLVLGAPVYALPAAGAGAAYPVDSSQILTVSSRTLTATNHRFRGAAGGDQAASAVAVGDVTGSAGADLIVTAPANDPAGLTDAGAIYIFPGPVTTGTSLSLSTAPVKILGNGQTGIRAGTSITVADVNGDGKGDLVVGVPRFDGPSLTDSGAVHVFFGGATLTGSLNLSGADLILTGAITNELAGTAVSGAGDLDGDGREDLLIGAPGASPGRTYLVYGGLTGTVSLGTQTLFTGAAGDQSGTAVVGPGDINGDGYRDLLIGAPGYSSGAGAVYAVYGGATRFAAGTISLTTTAGRYVGAAASQAGSSLAALGDVDGDGSADFAIGAPGLSSNAGGVHLMLGNGPRWWYPNADGDRVGVSTGAERRCGEPTTGWALTEGDCNDNDAAVYPGAAEICDGKDNNCDGLMDDEPGSGVVDPKTWYQDSDADRFVYLSTGQLSCTAPATDYIEDAQLLGFECETAPSFPSDNDASIHEGAAEVCDGKDNNCDGSVDEDQTQWPNWYPDGDGDGFGRNATPQRACTAPSGHVSTNSDCDDADPASYPGATETCDNKDNNCNGTVDEGVKTTYYADADGDGFGVPGSTTQACTRPTGYSTVSTDCNDSAGNGPRMYPGNTEVCDSLDNDCDFDTDEGVKSTYFLDADNDTQGSPYTFVLACVAPTGYVTNNTDCNDSNPAMRSGATEVCDNVDNDCDFQVDEGVKVTFYADVDGDGAGTTNVNYRIQACTAPTGYVTTGNDCNDGSSGIRPGRAEVCDGIDNDCDSAIDEGVPTSSWYPDNDRDGFGAQGSTAVLSCRAPSGNHVNNNTDCNDTSNRISPVQVEVCEAAGQTQVDNNCAGGVDDAINASTWYRDADADGYGSDTVTLVRCAQPAGYVAIGRDCNDATAAVNPGAAERCEANSGQVDNDCDGDANDVDPTVPVSQGGAPLWYGDGDRDGHAGSTFQLRWCTNPSDLQDANGNTVVRGAYLAGPPDDCNDSNSGAFAVETWYEDVDNNGCGNPNRSIQSCGQPGCNIRYVRTSGAGCT